MQDERKRGLVDEAGSRAPSRIRLKGRIILSDLWQGYNKNTRTQCPCIFVIKQRIFLVTRDGAKGKMCEAPALAASGG
jgi:hypothetical protein